VAGALGTLGICGADPRLGPVRADEIHPCWEERQPLVAAADVGGAVLFEIAPRRG
jgi:hypothetical protein